MYTFTICFAALFGAVVADQSCHWNGQSSIHGNGHCQCFDGFYNDDCSGDCGCSGHGTCKPDHTCQCEDGWKWSITEHKCVWDCQCDHGVSCMGPGVCGCSAHCQHGTCWNGQCECWEGYKGATCATYDPNIMMNKGVNVGMNIAGIAYYSSELKFVDVLKQSQAWITQRTNRHDWNTNEISKVHFRTDGYPHSLEPTMKLSKLVLRDFGEHAPHGTYTLMYDGEGDIAFELTSHQISKKNKGRWEVHLAPGKGGVEVTLLKTNPANPVRNIRLIMPGFADRYEQFPFYPVFLEGLRRYSEFRFMDFMHTNAHGPDPTTWTTRRKPDYHTQEGKSGGSLEYMVQLCNLMGASPWFNMPHAADDNFVTQFATQVKKTLRDDLHVYVEYSNEVWNGIFEQTRYSRTHGKQLNLDPADWKAGYLFYNIRAGEIADLWTRAYGSNSSKLVPVWAWQTGYFDYSRQVLDHLGSNANKFKAIAVTGYMSCGGVADGKLNKSIAAMTMSEILHHCNDAINHNYPATWNKFLQMAKEHGLKLLSYEAGPSVSEGSAIAHGTSQQAVMDKAIAFNKDTHMQTAVHNLLNKWESTVAKASSNGFPGGLFNYFSYTGSPNKYGSWGMLEYTGQNMGSVAKYRGVQQFITEHFPHNVLGPNCSFVKSGTLAYGCFMEGSHFQCGSSNNNGRTWTHFPDLHIAAQSYTILDGLDTSTHLLYVRVTDQSGVNSYHTTDARTHHSWNSVSTFDYYAQLSPRHVTQRMTNGVYNGLETKTCG